MLAILSNTFLDFNQMSNRIILSCWEIKINIFNPRMRNPIPCRVFEKTHLRMDLSQGTSKHGFEAKITFVSSFFQKRNIARSIFSLMNRYGEFSKKLCYFTTCYMWGWFCIYFFEFFKNLKSKGNFFYAKSNAKLLKNPHKIFI